MSRHESTQLARSAGVLLLSATFALLTFLALISPADPGALYRDGGVHPSGGDTAGRAAAANHHLER